MTTPRVDPHPASRLVGTVLGEWEMHVERGKIAEFARATHATSREYFAAGAPIPPTFLTTAAFWAPHEDEPLVKRLGLNLPRVLHGGQEFSFPNGLPHAGARLVVRQSVESVSTKQGKRGGSMTFIVLLTQYLDDEGQVMGESRTTTIEREAEE